MAYVSPTSASCPGEPHTGQGAYLKFEITSVSDSDAATNSRRRQDQDRLSAL